MADKLKDQLFEALKSGHVVTFSPSRIKGECIVAVRHPESDKYKHHELGFEELDITHILLRKLCR